MAGLAEALARYLGDDDLRVRHGTAGQQRVRRDFTPERVWDALLAEYDRLLAAAGRPTSVGGGRG